MIWEIVYNFSYHKNFAMIHNVKEIKLSTKAHIAVEIKLFRYALRKGRINVSANNSVVLLLT